MRRKSIPPVPCTFAVTPATSVVVAVPRTFGPSTLNTVAPMVTMMAPRMANLKLPR